jgi:hypothetical protein
MKRLVMMIVCDDLPFTFAESPYLRSLMAGLDLAHPSAGTVKREVMRCYREEVSRIISRLCNVGSKISITLDCWTSPHSTASYLGITVHYIDANWTLRSLLLDFVPLPGEHTGQELCDVLVATCERFGILGNILGVTTDNASNMIKLLRCFEQACQDRGVPFDKEQQHMRCVAHITNLALQALLHELNAEIVHGDSRLDTAPQTQQLPCIAKLRLLVGSIRLSPQRRGELESQCESCHVPSKEPLTDTRTRWNSTHAMIKRALELREPLDRVTRLNPSFPELDAEEWELLEVVEQVLGIFEEVTQKLSADSHPTLNRTVPIYNYIIDNLEGFLGQCNNHNWGRAMAAIIDRCSPTNKSIFKKAIKAAHEKICGYYGKTWADMYAIALILDPRYQAKIGVAMDGMGLDCADWLLISKVQDGILPGKPMGEVACRTCQRRAAASHGSVRPRGSTTRGR